MNSKYITPITHHWKAVRVEGSTETVYMLTRAWRVTPGKMHVHQLKSVLGQLPPDSSFTLLAAPGSYIDITAHSMHTAHAPLKAQLSPRIDNMTLRLTLNALDQQAFISMPALVCTHEGPASPEPPFYPGND